MSTSTQNSTYHSTIFKHHFQFGTFTIFMFKKHLNIQRKLKCHSANVKNTHIPHPRKIHTWGPGNCAPPVHRTMPLCVGYATSGVTSGIKRVCRHPDVRHTAETPEGGLQTKQSIWAPNTHICQCSKQDTLPVRAV